MNSFFNVWINPRGVVKRKIEQEAAVQPYGKYLLLAYISGLFSITSSLETEEPMTTTFFILSVFLGAVLTAVLSVFLMPLLFKWFGSWVGGRGALSEVRVAVMYTQVLPQILIGLILLPFIIIIGESYFLSATSTYTVELSAMQEWALLIAALIMITLFIWQFVIMLHGLGEAHGFSAWKSLLVYIIFTAILTVVLIVFMLIIVFAIGVTFI
ncbi:YIP1 family protein [Shouchella sp. 1P09AA]|uniref:YIP1 family protein n=1 Tax=unclassified Shouchella TaxID=2893065 RepID=UPI00399FA95B